MMKSDQGTKGTSVPVVLLISAMIAWGMFLILQTLSIPEALPCTHPSTQGLILSVICLMILHWVVGGKFFPRSYRYFLVVDTSLVLLTIWLGTYAYTPLSFPERENLVLHEFLVITAERGEKHIAPNAIITLSSNSVAYIQPDLGLGEISCSWKSLYGGALDGQDSCNVLYIPPPADYDILKLNIQPGCGLPNSVEQIRISILP